MALDASIPLQVRGPQFESPANALAQVLQVRGAQQQDQLGRMKLAEMQRGIERQNKLYSILGQSHATPEAREIALEQGGFMDESLKYGKARRENVKSDVDRQKAELETHLKRFEVTGQIMSGVRDQATYDMARQRMAQIFGPDAATQMPAQYDPVAIEQKRLQAMSVKEQLEAQHKQLTLGETQRHHRASEGIQIRGQNLVDLRQRELAQIARGAAAGTKAEKAEEKRVQNVDKEVTKFSNTIQKEGIPELETALSGAEAAVSRYPKGKVPGVGRVEGAIPSFALGSQGNDVRQAVATVRNIVLNARSGAAVTDQELRRLVEELGTGLGQSEDALVRGLSKVRTRLDKIKENAAAGVSDDVLNTYIERGGLPIKRGGKTAPTEQPKPSTKPNAAKPSVSNW